MSKGQSPIVHYYIRALILAGYTFYTVYLVNSDKLHYYIAPRMIPYVKWGAVCMFLFAAYTVYLAINEADVQRKAAASSACGCTTHHPQTPFKSIFLYGLFIIPLVLGYALPDKIMGSTAASVKGMNLGAATYNQQIERIEADVGEGKEKVDKQRSEQATNEDHTNQPAKDINELFPVSEYMEEFAELGIRLYGSDVIDIREELFMELLMTLDLYKENFLGKTVVMRGFVYREDDMEVNQFALSRIAMQCCSADAMPYGLLVQSADRSLADDAWIEITGKIGTTIYNDRQVIQLETLAVKPIETPDDPYVYPYFGDYLELLNAEKQ